MKYSRPVILCLCALLCALFLSPLTALAHDGSWTESYTTYDSKTLGHSDQNPWKGEALLTVTNSMEEDWGDFHFEIYEPLTYTNVIFTTEGTIAMLDASDNPYASASYVLAGDGKSIDFYYYANPVSNGETVKFQLYTDNTLDTHAWFGLTAYPTPVPEPATLVVLALGGLLFATRRK